MVTLTNTLSELRQILGDYSEKFETLPEVLFSAKPHPHRWSKKEILGHLIDSGQTNLRRFICGQYESAPRIVYAQDFWVAANSYQNIPKENLIQLWRLLNEQICEVLRTMPDRNASLLVDTGKEEPQLHSIAWLAEDYVKHLKHHLNQIIPGSFVISYP
jgi:hypothetical protein